MNRPDQILGKLAVAALAATAILILAPKSASAQRIVVPGAAADPAKKQTVRFESTGRVETVRSGFTGRAGVALPAAPLIVPLQGVAAANPQRLARQAFEQLRPTFDRELRLLTAVAGPTPSQRREIAVEAARTIREQADSFMKRNPAQQVAVVQALYNDPTKLVRQHLQLAARGKLSKAQADRYRIELDRKEEDRKEVGVLNIAANLERQLNLGPEQREKLCESLRKYWDDRDLPSLENSSVYDLYTPLLADAAIVPWLDDHQARIWRSLRKYHLASLRVPSPANPVLAVEFEDQDEDVMAAFGEEVKK